MENDVLISIVEAATLLLNNSRICRERPGLADKASEMLGRLFVGVNASSLSAKDDEEEDF